LKPPVMLLAIGYWLVVIGYNVNLPPGDSKR
jgi:hypothetical protein